MTELKTCQNLYEIVESVKKNMLSQFFWGGDPTQHNGTLFNTSIVISHTSIFIIMPLARYTNKDLQKNIQLALNSFLQSLKQV